MRVISQDGTIDVPYEEFVFGITKNNKIACCRECVATPSEIYNGIIAAYSSKEKALKAMEMLRKSYENNEFYHHTSTTDAFKDVASLLSNEKFDELTSEYFQFPQDNEIEV
jgi:hypothetical protein